MNIQPINIFQNKNSYINSITLSKQNQTTPTFKAKQPLNKDLLEQSADLRVFNHHIYEFKKGIRGLILTTEKAKYKGKTNSMDIGASMTIEQN